MVGWNRDRNIKARRKGALEKSQSRTPFCVERTKQRGYDARTVIPYCDHSLYFALSQALTLLVLMWRLIVSRIDIYALLGLCYLLVFLKKKTIN